MSAFESININELAKFLCANEAKLNDFIKAVNKQPGDKIRREKFSPVIYVNVLNRPHFKIKGKDVKLVRVGFSQVEMLKDTDSKMETVRKHIQSKLMNVNGIPEDQVAIRTLLILPIGALDTRLISEIEDSIRHKIGYRLPTQKGKELGLDTPKEWSITTQEFLDRIVVVKRIAKRDKKTVTVKLFNDNFVDETVKKFPDKKEEQEEIFKNINHLTVDKVHSILNLKCSLENELQMNKEEIEKEVNTWKLPHRA